MSIVPAPGNSDPRWGTHVWLAVACDRPSIQNLTQPRPQCFYGCQPRDLGQSAANAKASDTVFTIGAETFQ
jgi:hypothetical protein